MSEQSSLFIKINIKKDKLDNFLDSRPVGSILDSNWLSWWESRDMYSKTELRNIQTFNSESNRSILEDILKDKYIIAKQEYDDSEEIWYLLALQYSENYNEILPIISWIKDLASYLENDNKGFAFIYDYLWGDNTVMAYLQIENRKALLKNINTTAQIEPNLLNEANKKFEEFMNSFESN